MYHLAPPRCFVIIVQDMNISNPSLLLATGIMLIVVTISVFAHALWRTRSEVKALRKARKKRAPGSAAPTNDEETLDAVEAAGEANQKEGCTSPEKSNGVEIEMADIVPAASKRRSSKSAWSLLGLCAAPAEHDESLAEDTHQNDEVTSLLAKLAEKEAMLVDKELKLSEKDVEVMRLKALVSS